MIEQIKLLGFALLLYLSISCTHLKYIPKGNKIVGVTTNIPELEIIDTKTVYEVNKGFFSEIDVKENFFIIKNVDTKKLKPVGVPTTVTGGLKNDKKNLVGNYYAPEPDDVEKFVYWDSKPVLQSMAIVLKLRPRLNDRALLDSIPSQVETGFSPALAFGWKFTRNKFSAEKNIFDKNTQQWSITPGAFLGTGGVDLTKANTRAPKINFQRKAAFVSTGGFLTLGYNNINFGYTIGFDHATGEGSKGWLYKGKVWHGIVFGFDLIK